MSFAVPSQARTILFEFAWLHGRGTSRALETNDRSHFGATFSLDHVKLWGPGSCQCTC